MTKLKLFPLLSAAAILLSCSGYDDSDAVARMDSMDRELSALESLAEQINADLTSASALMDAFGKGDYITSCEALPDSSGYVIEFTESAAITVRHGSDGADGTDGTDATDGMDAADGVSPVIGFRKDDTGAWCWTLNGDFLLDDDGGHIFLTISSTEGKDGTVPRLRVKDGVWQMSLNNGFSWTSLGSASAAAQASPYIFSSVEPLGDVVRFTLSTGESLDILRLGVPNLELSGWQGLKPVPARSVEISYAVSNATSRTVVRVLGNNGYTASVSASSVSEGTITVTAPASVSEGDVLAVADNGYGCLSMRKMHFSSTGITVSELEDIGLFEDFEW